jgi:hypothetical protein
MAAILWWRNSRPRRLRIERLWIRPLLFALMVGLTLTATPVPLDPLSISVLGLALVTGAALGWQRGRFMRIDVHPESHDVTSRASPMGMIFILTVLALRLLLRDATLESHTGLGLPTAAITDGLILLVGAMIVAQTAEMWLRARRLLGEARASKAAAHPSSPA